MSLDKPRKSVKRAQIEELQAENAFLRARLDQTVGQDEQLTYEVIPAQEVRDDLAVRALMRHAGDVYASLRDLGFILTGLSHKEKLALAERVFTTDGVKARLVEVRRGIIDKQRLLARQVEIAAHGNEDQAIRAFSNIARMMGWTKPGDVNITVNRNSSVSAFQLFGDKLGGLEESQSQALPANVAGILSILDHEPGAPVKVHSEAVDETEA